MKDPRPDIIKLKITQIGGFDDDGIPDKKWIFDGSHHPKSVGNYYSKDWALIAGYTIDELKEISKHDQENSIR